MHGGGGTKKGADERTIGRTKTGRTDIRPTAVILKFLLFYTILYTSESQICTLPAWLSG